MAFFWQRIALITAVLFLVSACGNGYSAREFPPEGKKAFEDYLEKYATKFEDITGSDDPNLGYMIQWAPKGREFRTNITGGWCIIAVKMIWLGDTPTFFFVVYQTNNGKWLVSASKSDYEKMGCLH